MRNHADRSAGKSLGRTLGFALFVATLAVPARGEHLLNWITVDTGGGDVANSYLIRGTVGQPEADVPASGGIYQVRGGFWRGAIALASRLIFADGFEDGGSAIWSDTTPLAPDTLGSIASRQPGRARRSSAL